jgi:undecaprenyldiphospho-muramoylpentapeptide beta-N-acetylglucosaminyltransferase
MERELVPAAGFPVELLPGRGIQRKLTWQNVGAIWGLLRAVVKGIGIVHKKRPHVVVVLGGYASLACIIGAVLWRVPLVVMEQNARAGAASRLAARFAKRCCVPFAQTDLPKKVVTGNPVRKEVLAVSRETQRDAARSLLNIEGNRRLIAVVTGSLGARKVNEAVFAAVELLADRQDLSVYHVVGSRDWDQWSQRLPAPDGLQYQAVRYENHMENVLAAADLLISRAGGSTVAEVAQVGIASVLIPLPNAPRDHQTANAQALVAVGAARCLADQDLSGERLVNELRSLLEKDDQLEQMARAAKSLAVDDPAARVADVIEEVVDEVSRGKS